MNYNQIFINKCSLLLDSRKASIPTSVFEYYKNINLYQKRNIKSLREMTNEVKCLLNVIDNLSWIENYNLTINRDDIFLNKGYMQTTFLKELTSPLYEFRDIKKLVELSTYKYDNILKFAPSIIIKIKKEGINICDGYHRIFAALSQQPSIQFKCTVGLIKN
jgi:hypothetical protein